MDFDEKRLICTIENGDIFYDTDCWIRPDIMEASLFIAALVIIAVGDGLLADYKRQKSELKKRKEQYGYRI